ncbi:MAG TPA: hypothetical protein HA356_02860 [Candidatus Poseidoniaceae archaeon]|nr:hypothetical protein [Candidatus Poseidoniaceae archaeon]|tara:strand:+ start:3372 stop:3554 length:183 start_codon:yes stop_codon:yes gene_type:complete
MFNQERRPSFNISYKQTGTKRMQTLSFSSQVQQYVPFVAWSSGWIQRNESVSDNSGFSAV